MENDERYLFLTKKYKIGNKHVVSMSISSNGKMIALVLTIGKVDLWELKGDEYELF